MIHRTTLRLLALVVVLIVAEPVAVGEPNKKKPKKKDSIVETAKQFEEMLPIKVLPIPGAQPTLPLTGNSPFPPSSAADAKKYLDPRTMKERYLGGHPSNVGQDGTVDGTDVKSHFDHPGVQPRAQRSQHYRVCVENQDALPANFPPSGNFASLKSILPRHDVWVTYVQTAPGMFPKVDPFRHPPGTNMLPTVYRNMRDRNDNEMPNTLPSHPNNPYNLHVAEPVVTRLPTNKSPTDDLRYILDNTFELVTGIAPRSLWQRLDEVKEDELIKSTEEHTKKIKQNRDLLLHYCNWAIDMIEGNHGDNSKVPSNRAYRGFALLHHSGHHRNTRIMPVFNNKGEVVGGNADVHQIWYDGRIESDTMFFDFGWDDDPHDWKRKDSDPKKKPLPIPPDVPWTVTYTIDILNRGEDDFSPTQVYFDDVEEIAETPGEIPSGKVYDPSQGKSVFKRFGPPHVAMDQTFFPMAEGTRTKLKIKMSPDSWDKQLRTYYDRQPVFAMFSGIAASHWKPVHDFCEQTELPCLFPHTEFPALREGNHYTLYLSKGLAVEAQVVAKQIAEMASNETVLPTVVQIYREGDRQVVLARELRRELQAQRFMIEDAPITVKKVLTESDWERLISRKASLLVLWLNDEDLHALIKAERKHLTRLRPMFASASLLDHPVDSINAVRDAVPLLTSYAYELPGREVPRIYRVRSWLRSRGVASPHEHVVLNTYFALSVADHALVHMVDHFSRDYLIESIEHETENALNPGVYPRMSLGPGQRFASRGSYLLPRSLTPQTALKWIVPD